MDEKSGYGLLIVGGKVKYKGMWENDCQHGEGEIFLQNGENYVGDFFEGKMEGIGIYTYPSGCEYVGEFLQDMKNG